MATSLERRLDEVERPKAHLVELTGQTLPIRIYGSAWFHRLLPDPVALRLAALRGWLEWFVVSRHLVVVQAPVFLQEAEQVHAHAIDVWDDAVARLTRPKVGR